MFRLKYWYRGKIKEVEVNGIPHARAVLDKVKATGAVVLKLADDDINDGKWFHYLTLR